MSSQEHSSARGGRVAWAWQVGALLCALPCGVAPAWAQQTADPANATSFQVEQFEPLPSQGYNILNVATSDVLPSFKPSAGLFFHYVNDPIQVVPVTTGDVDQGGKRLIANQLKAELLASVGILNRAEVGLAMPLVVWQSGDDLGSFGKPDASVEGFATGDLRVIPKLRLLHPARSGGFGAAFLLPIYVPVGDTETFNSDGKVRVEPRLALDWRHEAGLVVSANVAYQLLRAETIAQNYTSANMFRWALGAQLPSGVESMRIITSLHGSISSADARTVVTSGGNERFDRSKPVELDGGLLFFLPFDLTVSVGGGAGLTAGVGAPDFRVFASLGYASRAVDSDGDGILDVDDQCPLDPEDFDGYQDEDGCPDPDNDGDGILDVNDQCPDEPEDKDGFEDEDGCPDPDNDGDGIPDEQDACPLDPEDKDGFEDGDGCPDPDNDGDGILDADDQCPNEPEDFDEYQDEDGCPDPDNDGDGILDVDDLCPLEAGVKEERGCPIRDRDGDGIPDHLDKCPDEPETYNGYKDDDGCPDGKELVQITETEIKIFQKVFFDTGKDRIQKKSFALLDTVSTVLKRNPQITRMRVEGHTDDVGADADNLELSRRRAEAVRAYLIDQGIEPGRVQFEGYGEERPLCQDIDELLKNARKNRKKLEACRSDNRRVEFRIVEINGQRVQASDSVKIERREE